MKQNIYDLVTNRIVEELENGKIPWHRPWTGIEDGAINYVTRNPYSFLNQILLGEPGEYMTFNQCKQAGGSIKKGAKSKMVVFFSFVENKNNPKIDDDGNEYFGMIPILRYYSVFHINDCEGLRSKINYDVKNEFHPIDEAEMVINEYLSREKKLSFNQKASNRAYYSIINDKVVVPLKSQFEIEEEYYSTAFHELTHSTMPAYRCNRKYEKEMSAFGSEDYSREELVAELGSAMLCNHCHIECDKAFRNSVAYIQSWLKALKNDKKMIVWASSKAEKAVKYILNINE